MTRRDTNQNPLPLNTPGADQLEPFFAFLDRRRNALLALAAGLFITIALLDWLVFQDISVGALYVFPILLVAAFLRPGQILPLAAACSVLRELFSPIHWHPGYGARLVSWWCAFSAIGIFVGVLARNRQVILQRSLEVQQQSELLKQAEHQIRILIDTSPLAILTLDEDGAVQLSNDSAQRLFETPMAGQDIREYLPVLARPLALHKPIPLRTKLECRGRRHSGEAFWAHIWFSTYDTREGRRLAAVVWDGSESLRDRERAALSSTMDTSRIVIGSLSHEVGNLCRSAHTSWHNLAAAPHLTESRDYQALGTLLTALDKISRVGVRLASQHVVATADLYSVLDEALIVIGPAFEEAHIELGWKMPEDLPFVLADHHGLLQVFLNLANNARRAMRQSETKRFAIEAGRQGDMVTIRFQDTGPGVREPDTLFTPFQPGAEATGLGLYVSRQILRSCGGDLRHEPTANGACLVVQLLEAHAG